MSEFLDTETAYSTSTTTQEIEIGEDTAKIVVADATFDEIERFEKKEAEGDLNDTELMQEVFDEYLVRPEELDAKKMPMSKMVAVFKGVLKAWGLNDDELAEFLEEREGN